MHRWKWPQTPPVRYSTRAHAGLHPPNGPLWNRSWRYSTWPQCQEFGLDHPDTVMAEEYLAPWWSLECASKWSVGSNPAKEPYMTHLGYWYTPQLHMDYKLLTNWDMRPPMSEPRSYGITRIPTDWRDFEARSFVSDAWNNLDDLTTEVLAEHHPISPWNSHLWNLVVNNRSLLVRLRFGELVRFLFLRSQARSREHFCWTTRSKERSFFLRKCIFVEILQTEHFCAASSSYTLLVSFNQHSYWSAPTILVESIPFLLIMWVQPPSRHHFWLVKAVTDQNFDIVKVRQGEHLWRGWTARRGGNTNLSSGFFTSKVL